MPSVHSLPYQILIKQVYVGMIFLNRMGVAVANLHMQLTEAGRPGSADSKKA